MRIIAGIVRGQPLAVPRGGNVRPTSDRVRAAIFSSLGDRVVGATVLDIYAGTGALGLEAASRGARAVTFVENASIVTQTLEKNIAAVRRNREVQCEFRVIRSRPPDVFDLIFADPPYGDEAQAVLDDEAFRAALAPDGVLVLESAKRKPLAVPAAWQVIREAVYGDTRVSFLRRQPEVG